ncbi:MAG: hypothetical protein KJO08_00505, partial [Gammaproteobacteria bacterium]|nr:hypothetical protein [Gammaproteobacteria bacterium]
MANVDDRDDIRPDAEKPETEKKAVEQPDIEKKQNTGKKKVTAKKKVAPPKKATAKKKAKAKKTVATKQETAAEAAVPQTLKPSPSKPASQSDDIPLSAPASTTEENSEELQAEQIQIETVVAPDEEILEPSKPAQENYDFLPSIFTSAARKNQEKQISSEILEAVDSQALEPESSEPAAS